MRSHALASAALLLLLLLHTTSSSTQGLTLDLYANGALGGAPFSSAVIASLDNVSLPGGDHAEPFSAEITGTVTLLRNESYTFSCQASEAITMLLLHVGGHPVCQRGADGAGAGDVYTLSADTLVFRMAAYGNGTAAATVGSKNWLSVSWAKGAHPHAAAEAAAAAAPAAAAAAAPAAAAAAAVGGQGGAHSSAALCAKGADATSAQGQGAATRTLV